MIVLRRLDAVLEPTKSAALSTKDNLDKAGVTNQDAALSQSTGQALYYTSRFNMRDLRNGWRDTETAALKEPGGIEAFIHREVLPHAPDAWIDEAKTTIGYEISFTRYFYTPQPLRSMEAIRADILALERETEGLMVQIAGGKR